MRLGTRIWLITELTAEQEALLSVYRDKWLSIGLSTERIGRASLTESIEHFYVDILKRKEPIVVFMPNPLWAWVACTLLWEKSKVRSEVESKVASEVESKVWSEVWSEVESKVASEVESKVWSEVESKVWSKVWSEVRSEVWSEVRSKVKSEVESKVRSEVESKSPSFVWPYVGGQFDASSFSFYDYCEEVLGCKYASSWNTYKALTNSGPIWALESVAIVCERPLAIHLNNGVLHNETGPAVSYEEGFNCYVLNGVRVSKEIVETPAEEIDVKSILTTDMPADARREIVRKVGVERVCQQLDAECVDNVGDYELLLLDIGDRRKRPYLKMLNPSIGIYHIEGVEPSCRTVEQALNWRNGLSVPPTLLT